MTFLLVFNFVQLFLVEAVNVANAPQPIFERGLVVDVLRGCSHPPAIVVAADYYVRDLEIIYSKLNRAHRVEVRADDHVGHVPDNEHRAGVFSHYFVRRDAGVRAADPQVGGMVVGDLVLEEIGTVNGLFRGNPRSILGEDVCHLLRRAKRRAKKVPNELSGITLGSGGCGWLSFREIHREYMLVAHSPCLDG